MDFGIVAVGGTYYVLTLRYGATVFWSGLAIGSLAVVLLAINNLRDLSTDQASGKKTVAVRIGERGARLEIAFFTILPYPIAAALALWPVFLSLPLAVVLIWRVHRCRGASLNRCLAMAGALQWAFALLFALSAVFAS